MGTAEPHPQTQTQGSTHRRRGQHVTPPFLRHMARVEYMLSDHVSALGNQHKATLILERVLGVDHPETLSAYINLALYHQANNQSNSALRLLYRWAWHDSDDVIMMSLLLQG